ncbi:MAG: DNA mismatch repair endonuclease MutL [Halobacteriaceae archaeon]
MSGDRGGGGEPVPDGTDIRPLDATTVERIAAGEVVERPASVVKELVENSLDAGADRIEVEIDGDGTERIAVRDDGAGMSEADVRAAVRQHTTSKLADADELERGVATLGFRGEALYSIAAVSKLTITTRRLGADAGTELRAEGGEVVAVDPAGRGPGTTVEVRDLFYNVPARREYLSREATEFDHVNRVAARYALANPDVAIALSHDGSEVFATPGRGDLQEALLAVYGRDVAESMVGVEAAPGGPVDRVHGAVSHPETTRSSRRYLSTFVNGRYVESSALREAVLSAYGGQLAADRFPFAVLFLELPGETVDVNVHPRKLEVRFGDEAGVREAVETAVRDALLDAGLLRSSAPRGRSAPDDAAVDPGSADEPDPPAPEAAGAGGTDRQSTDDPGDAARGPPESGDAEAPDADPTATDADRGPASSATADSAGAPSGQETDSASAGDTDSTTPDADPADEAAETREAAGEPAGASDETGGQQAFGSASNGASDRFERAPSARDLTGEPTRDPDLDQLPAMRVLGQLAETYVVGATDEALVLVDQHAADERITYEDLAADLAGDATSQTLVEPVAVPLTAAEAAAFEAVAPELSALGFAADLEGDEEPRAVVSAVPAVLADSLDPDLVRDALSAFLDGRDPERVTEAAADELLADMACYPAVTGNTALADGSIIDLLEALDDCENPYTCPHGRPTVIELSEAELEDRFERDYPGHAVRRPAE